MPLPIRTAMMPVNATSRAAASRSASNRMLLVPLAVSLERSHFALPKRSSVRHTRPSTRQVPVLKSSIASRAYSQALEYSARNTPMRNAMCGRTSCRRRLSVLPWYWIEIFPCSGSTATTSPGPRQPSGSSLPLGSNHASTISPGWYWWS